MISDAETNRIINKAVDADWFLLAKRSDIPPLPVWYKIKFSAKSREFKKIFGANVPWACFWKGDKTELYLHGKEYRMAIRTATKLFYSKKKFSNHLKKLERYCLAAQNTAAIFEKSQWKELKSGKLLEIYLSAVDKYVLSFVHGFITWCVQVVHNDAQKILEKYSQDLKKTGITPEQALSILIVPAKLTAYQEKELALERLSKKYKKFIKTKRSKLSVEIENFLQKYGWIGFNYTGPAMDYQAVVRELARPREKKRKSPKKEDIYKICKFNSEEKKIFYALEKVSYTKDLRNATDDYAHYCFSKFYAAIEKRNNLAEKDAHFLWDEELNDLILGNKKLSQAYIRNKKEFCAAFSAHKMVKKRQYYTGKEARRQHDLVFRNSDQNLKFLSKNILKGITASAGFARGKAKVVNSSRENGKVKKGDILVATMTSPKFLPAIRNAGAIVTDDGGLTNHAAIIARELKIPCIVGTKIATRVLKDGDSVEVDANKGIVKIIKRQK